MVIEGTSLTSLLYKRIVGSSHKTADCSGNTALLEEICLFYPISSPGRTYFHIAVTEPDSVSTSPNCPLNKEMGLGLTIGILVYIHHREGQHIEDALGYVEERSLGKICGALEYDDLPIFDMRQSVYPGYPVSVRQAVA